MHLFTPNHVQLLNACYPPTSALPTAGPEYAPKSQELSRLTYYASNHPGKLTKLGAELEKRVKADSKKAKGGNIRSKASLLITFAIFRALGTECRRDIALLAPCMMASIETTLSALPSDLEVIARVASVFTTFTTYTDGKLIGADNAATTSYLADLQQFAGLSSSLTADQETRNRTRLIGFAALTGAVNSDALYNSTSQYRAQVSTIMRPILFTLFQTEIAMLNQLAAAVKDSPSPPYLAEFRSRPALERRAASIHIHVDGENGPTLEDVSRVSLHALYSLASHANGAQLGYIMQATFEHLNDIRGWEDIEHCSWISLKMAEWSQYQYRFAVPTWLVERLSKGDDAKSSDAMHRALAAMATTVFDSPVPLVNLSTSDMISHLTTMLLRRAEKEDDPLIPALVECIASLGRHVYYSDQIQDLAGELITRLTVVEVQGVGRGKGVQNRVQAARSLLAALLGLLQTADSHDNDNETTSIKSSKRDLSLQANSRRSRVPPDMLQDTLSLICDQDYSIRADYFDLLIFYLKEEMSKPIEAVDINGVKRARKAAEGSIRQAVDLNVLLHAGNPGTKFLHAVHAHLYILATRSPLGLANGSSTPPSRTSLVDSPPVIQLTTDDDEEQDKERVASPDSRRRSFSAARPRARKLSIAKRLLGQDPLSPSHDDSAACPGDYAAILNIITAIHEEVPIRGLLTGIPMVLSLYQTVQAQDSTKAVAHRLAAIRELVTRVWLIVGKVWGLNDLKTMAEAALSCGPNILPEIPSSRLTSRLPPRDTVKFTGLEAVVSTWEGVNVQQALSIIASAPAIHEATGLDEAALLRRFTAKWTAESAFEDSLETTSFENTTRGDGIAPLLKISPALMHIENISQQSLARSARGVGVADLRGALEGRYSMSNPALVRPPSLSTLEHAPSTLDALQLSRTRSKSRKQKRPPPRGPAEVRDVLNKLGIGKQGNSLLKASFSQAPKVD